MCIREAEIDRNRVCERVRYRHIIRRVNERVRKRWIERQREKKIEKER